jgi:hypothetical protein
VSWLVEDRWTIIGLGVLAQVLLGVALLHTRRGAVAAAMVLALVLTGAGVLLEWLIVTDREAALATLHEAAAAVRSGDEDRVLQFIAPEEREGLEAAVRYYLGMFEFTSIAINAPETEILDGAQRTARIRFTARVEVRGKGAMDVIRNEIVQPLEIRMRKEGDRWLVTGYEQEKWVPGGR